MSAAQVPVSTSDRMAITCSTAVRSRNDAVEDSSVKNKVANISPIVDTMLYSRQTLSHCDDSIQCVSIEFVEFFFKV